MGSMPIILELFTFDSADPFNRVSDGERLATLRNVLHGTARDWWDVARLGTITWTDFETKFRAGFL